MRDLSLLVTIFFFTACQHPLSNNPQPVDYEEIADQITARTTKKIEAETGLRLMGTGGGMMNHIRMIAMSFACLKEITLEEGREL